MREWVLVPTEPTPKMVEADVGFYEQGRTNAEQCSIMSYMDMIAARPPLPRPVFDAMVERMARAVWDDPDETDLWRFGQALRALDPTLVVEGE